VKLLLGANLSPEGRQPRAADNSENLCERKRFAFLNLKAQNSRRLKEERPRLNIPGCRRVRAR